MRNRLFVLERTQSAFSAAAVSLKLFTRFEQFPEMLLFARIQSTPCLVRDTLDFFCYRFPPFVIALYNETEKQLFVQSRRKDFPFRQKLEFDSPERALEWLRPFVQSKVGQRMDFSVEWKDEYFSAFFDSQFIENRKNQRLQKQMMRPFLLPRESIEFRSFKKFRHIRPNTRLTEFFFEKTPAKNRFITIDEKNREFKPKNAE